MSCKELLIKQSLFVQYSPFQLTSLINAEIFKFENPAIMDKQCKQTERFSLMAKGSDYFLSFDSNFKQRYEIKINKILIRL